MMFWLAGTSQEAGAGGRSGAAGIPVFIDGAFFLMFLAYFTFLLSTVTLWLALVSTG